ncbi:MAG: hypothetical protein ACXVCP_15445 [Bdellovibrio sp.]
MKVKLIFSLFLLLLAAKGQCFELKPKTQIKFYCSVDNKALLVTDGTTENVIESDMIIWKQGFPEPGCNEKIVSDITAKGFYCDGHYLSDYTNSQTEYADVESCQEELNSKPRIRWN